MAAKTFDMNCKLVRRRHKRTDARCKFTNLHTGVIMHSVNFLHTETIHHAVVNHFFTATAAFFGGLEYNHGCTVKIAGFR